MVLSIVVNIQCVYIFWKTPNTRITQFHSKHGLGLPIHVKNAINIWYYELVYPIGITNISYIDALLMPY